MPKIPIIKSKDFINFLIKYGCEKISIRGSHHKMHNPKTNKTTVVEVHAGTDMMKRSFSDSLKQLDIDVNDFIDFINH